MPRANVGEIELEYDCFGKETDEVLLLIMGLGGQMLIWEEDFCEMLASRGHRVVRFDNRDVGLSTWFDEAGIPDAAKMFADGMAGKPVECAYTLDDMADDAVGLLDVLGAERAHVCGVSMGGMIAQALAIRHADRVSSLTSIMSTTGQVGLPGPTPEAGAILATPPPQEREAFIEDSARRGAVVGSPAYPADPDFMRERSALLYDRAFHPAGTARQLAAVAAHGDRTAKLAELQVPTLVVHGKADPLIPFASGIATHEAIRNSELLLLEGMGHDLPRPLWGEIVEAISSLTERTRTAT